jgi:hypothetical protein
MLMHLPRRFPKDFKTPNTHDLPRGCLFDRNVENRPLGVTKVEASSERLDQSWKP